MGKRGIIGWLDSLRVERNPGTLGVYDFSRHPARIDRLETRMDAGPVFTTLIAQNTIAALRAIQAHHTTAHGVQVGFLMQDATTALGSFAHASNTLTMLMMDGLIESEPAVVNGEVQTIYRVADSTPPKSRSVH